MQEKISSFVSYFSAVTFAGFGAFTFRYWVNAIAWFFVIMANFTNRYYKKKLRAIQS
ncbi:hypothetical protein ACP6H1_17455 [Vibrio harveyi]|uniref:hypothetical protein n=1 Tax=Vibrio harveyi TaxID=669 RepID=UPI003CEE1E59